MYSRFRLPILLVLLSAITLLIAADEVPIPVSSQNRLNDQDILAEFDGGTITRKDVDSRISKIPPNQQGRFRTVAGQTQVLDVMALEEVLMAKALQLGIDQNPDVLSKIDAGLRQFYIQEYYTRNVTDKVQLTDADKRAYFNDNPQIFIVLPLVTINYIQAADEASALKALDELKSGAGWEQVSEAYNQNTYVKGLKGVIKNIRLNGNIPGVGNDTDLEALIQANTANLNALIGPVQTNTGWHIFTVVDFKEGRSKTYEEVIPEIEQRLRPVTEKNLLDQIKSELMLKYQVSIDSAMIAKVDLNSQAKNDPIKDQPVLSSNHPELSFTVATLLEAFNRLAPQEQVFYVKGEGAVQLIDQELIRALLYLDAKDNGYEQFFEQKDEYQQMRRFYILNTAYRQLVIDSVVVPQEEVRAYYDSHIQDYTTPASRAIQILWFKDQNSADRTWKKFQRMYRLGDEKRMQQLIDEESTNPALALLDNQYNNGVVTGIGPDAEFSKRIWDNPVGYLSPVFTSARGDLVFFRTLRENPPVVKSFTEIEPRIFGILKKEKEAGQQDKINKELSEEFNLVKYPERINLLLSAEELFTLADDAARMRNFKDAITFYDQIIQNYPNGNDDYKAYFMKAFLVAEELKNNDLALDLFKSFLAKFPTGDLNESAQFMIDTLEGKLVLEIEEEPAIPEASQEME